jgi:hypothetical protein
VDESFSHRRKLVRADIHIENIEAMFECWASDGYRVFEETNSEGATQIFAEQLKPLPDQMGLTVGDALHCQRSSLDHLVFALAKANTPALTDEQEEDVAFPIYDWPAKIGSKRIRWLSRDAQRDICDLSPNPTRDQLDQHPLWLLNKMENRDKHREISVTVTAAHVAFLAVTGGREFFRDYGIAFLEPGADPVLMGEFTRRKRPNDDVRVAPNVAFGKGTELANKPVRKVLRDLSNYIRETVFERLEPHLNQPLP